MVGQQTVGVSGGRLIHCGGATDQIGWLAGGPILIATHVGWRIDVLVLQRLDVFDADGTLRPLSC